MLTSEILTRLALASLFGAFVGLERERKDWAAGMRTHMMVCVGSCLIMLVSSFGFSDVLGTAHVALDPSRIAAQVISGIGFIGAGTILFLKQGTVRGLTTASGLWTVAAIGLATGGGMYFAAVATTVIALIILWALQPLEKMYARKFKQKTLKIVTNLNVDNTALVKSLFQENQLEIKSFTFERAEDQFVFLLQLEHMDEAKLAYVINALKKDETIKDVFWGY